MSATQNNNYASFVGAIISGGRATDGNALCTPWLVASNNNALFKEFFDPDTTVLLQRDIDLGFMPLDPTGTPRLNVPKLVVGAKITGSLNLRKVVIPIANDLCAETLYQYIDAATNPSNGLFIRMICRSIGVGTEDFETEFSPEKNGVATLALRMGGSTTHEALISTFMTEGAADPVASDIADGFGTFWKNTTSGACFAAVNDGGTIKKVALV